MRLLIRYFFKTVRLFLTPIVLGINWITTPRAMERTPEQQLEVDKACDKLQLYQFVSCPFCIKVRREMIRLALPIDKRDAQKDMQARDELMAGGGELKVPCLCITEEDGSLRWMYESDDIIAYLRGRFA